MERYDPHTNQWIQCTPMSTARHGMRQSDSFRNVCDINPCVIGFAAAALDGALYIMGGSTSLAAVERYDERTGQWTSLPVLLTGRDFLAAVAVDGAVFSIGGRRDKLAQNKVERFDARNNRWMPVVCASVVLPLFTRNSPPICVGFADGGETWPWCGSCRWKDHCAWRVGRYYRQSEYRVLRP